MPCGKLRIKKYVTTTKVYKFLHKPHTYKKDTTFVFGIVMNDMDKQLAPYNHNTVVLCMCFQNGILMQTSSLDDEYKEYAAQCMSDVSGQNVSWSNLAGNYNLQVQFTSMHWWLQKFMSLPHMKISNHAVDAGSVDCYTLVRYCADEKRLFEFLHGMAVAFETHVIDAVAMSPALPAGVTTSLQNLHEQIAMGFETMKQNQTTLMNTTTEKAQEIEEIMNVDTVEICDTVEFAKKKIVAEIAAKFDITKQLLTQQRKMMTTIENNLINCMLHQATLTVKHILKYIQTQTQTQWASAAIVKYVTKALQEGLIELGKHLVHDRARLEHIIDHKHRALNKDLKTVIKWHGYILQKLSNQIIQNLRDPLRNAQDPRYDALKQTLDQIDAEQKEINTKLADLKSSDIGSHIQEFRSSIESVCTNLEANIKESLESKIKQLQQEHDDSMARMVDIYQGKMNKQLEKLENITLTAEERDQYQQNIEKLQQEHNLQMQEQQRAHNEQLQKEKAEFKKNICKFHKAVNTLSQQPNKIHELDEKIEELKQENWELRANQDEMMQDKQHMLKSLQDQHEVNVATTQQLFNTLTDKETEQQEISSQLAIAMQSLQESNNNLASIADTLTDTKQTKLDSTMSDLLQRIQHMSNRTEQMQTQYNDMSDVYKELLQTQTKSWEDQIHKLQDLLYDKTQKNELQLLKIQELQKREQEYTENQTELYELLDETDKTVELYKGLLLEVPNLSEASASTPEPSDALTNTSKSQYNGDKFEGF